MTRQKTHRRLAAMLVFGMLLAAGGARAGTFQEVTGFGSNPGNLRMTTYIPDNLPPAAPLVVALHGCTQSAQVYLGPPGWRELADRYGFAVLLPEQRQANNSNLCFNWFEPGDIERDRGEPLSIRQMIERVRADYAIDPARLYVTGLSAGGAMTAVMLATYPDLFAGGAIVAGLPYKCGTSLSQALTCMYQGRNQSPAAWGNLVRNASNHTGPWPIVSIWHGTTDATVIPSNGVESLDQWTNVHGIDQTPDAEESVGGNPHRIYRDAAGTPRVETWTINGMGHGTPVDPPTAGRQGPEQCGAATDYILDVDVCSSYYIARFWRLAQTDRTAPTVRLTAPADGAAVSGAVALSAEASDDNSVARVEFLADGRVIATDATAPYTASWNSAAAVNGPHELSARAIDAAGNIGTAPPVSVTVSAGLPDRPPTVTVTQPATGATVAGLVPVVTKATDDVAVTAVELRVDGAAAGSATRRTDSSLWDVSWDSRTVAEGSHSLQTIATDTAGQTGASTPITVQVTRDTAALMETFSNRSGTGLYDLPGWTADGWSAAPANATPDAPGSRSAEATASAGRGCATGTTTRRLSRTVVLPDRPRLRYVRQLDLRSQVNLFTPAAFRVTVDGQTIDERTVTLARYRESDWTERTGIDLSAYANRSVTLAFEVMASSNVCIETSARAAIDDIRIDSVP
jgi:poly(hydroxyalkanoate) depolymerase family esterase